MLKNSELNEQKHALHILQKLNAMKDDKHQCDFVVRADGEEYHVHRNILSAGSDYFNAMLTHDTKENQDGEVEMMDVNPDCVKICIDYIYTGKADYFVENFEELMYVACLMQLNPLSAAISEFVEESLDVDTFYRTRSFAELFGIEHLIKKCEIFEEDNFVAICAQSEFEYEKKGRLAKMLKSEEASLTEIEKLIVIVRWAGDDLEKKCKVLELLENINWEEIPNRVARNILDSHPLIANDLDLYKLLSKSIMNNMKIGSLNLDEKKSMVTSLILFDESSDSLQQFNPQTNKVQTFKNCEFSHLKDFTALVFRSDIYIFMGNKSVYKSSIRDNGAKWEKMQDMLKFHGPFPPVIFLNGIIYAIGGSDTEITGAIEEYFPEKDYWSFSKRRPYAVSSAALVCLDNFIYSIGGETEAGPTDSFLRYNPALKEWEEMEPMRVAKYNCSSVSVESRIYVFGGENAKFYLTSTECYDVCLKQWTRLSNMIKRHFLPNVYYTNGCILAVGRMEYLHSNAEIYNIEKDRWRRLKVEDAFWLEAYNSVQI